MRDRQIFEEAKLSNGIHIYAYPDASVTYSYLEIIVPVGTANNIGDVLPGTAHYLEHMLCSGHRTYEKFIGLKGGKFNAVTGTYYTQFNVRIASKFMKAAWDGLFSLVFKPLFTAENLRRQHAIILNERKKTTCYPGGTNIGHYLSKQWMDKESASLEQIFGSNEDLSNMTIEKLENFHKNFFSKDIKIMLGGIYDIEFIKKSLSKIQTYEMTLPCKILPRSWKNREYHEKVFDDTNRYEFYIGGFLNDQISYQDEVAIDFLGRLLINQIHGPLYEWIREEKGVYEMKFVFSNYNGCEYTFFFPFSSLSDVLELKNEFHIRVQEAISNTVLLKAEVERRLNSIDIYEDLKATLNSGKANLLSRSRITSEKDHRKMIKNCADPNFMMKIYETYFQPSQLGEVCIVPSEK